MPVAATVAGRLGAGSGCDTTWLLAAGRVEIEPVVSGALARLVENGLEYGVSKRAESEQLAVPIAINATAMTRGETRGRHCTSGRVMWLLVGTQQTETLK